MQVETWDDDCPALPICAAVGNARQGCSAGAPMYSGHPRMQANVCIAGLILLIARGQGLYTEEMETELQNRRIGYLK